VAKLFNIVQPDRAYFGQKDFQQAVILRRMTRDLNFPIQIIVGPTVRETDGLARSSRNVYLDAEERRQAPALYAALRSAAERIACEAPPAEEVLADIRAHLAEHAPAGEIDYVAAVDPQTLRPREQAVPPVALAVAVKFRGARLIDNILLDSTGKIS
jgi:pantoate--beta-alanine ligase